MTSIRTIRLGGALAEQFGAEHRLAVDHVGEAVVALNALYPRFNNAIRALDEQGMVFRVAVADRDVCESELTLVSTGDILIMPVVAGANATTQTVLGVALIVMGFYTFGATSAMGMAMIASGAGLALGGIVGMMSTIPTVDAGSADSGNSKSSYLFGGSQNTGAQGVPVPVGCGERRYSGIVISAGISVEDM